MSPTPAQLQQLSQTIVDQLDSPLHYKQASDAVNDFTRMRLREDSFRALILPTLTITQSDLDRQVDTDLPVKVLEKEPDSPAAMSIGFGGLPMNFYIRGPRYRVTFDRTLTPRAVKDAGELLSYGMDIRQVLSDNMVKDLLAEDDTKFITASETAIGGALGATAPVSGVVQWRAFAGGVDRNNVVESLKIMPQTSSHLEPGVGLLNHVTVLDFLKWDRNEAGGDLSQDFLKNGWHEVELFKRRWLVTIKRSLVPDGRVYYYADPKFLGKMFELEPATMYVKKEAFMIEWFVYKTTGGAFGNTDGIAIADFQ
jgi:hypothetical protein